jgi:hypothetical protein
VGSLGHAVAAEVDDHVGIDRFCHDALGRKLPAGEGGIQKADLALNTIYVKLKYTATLIY